MKVLLDTCVLSEAQRAAGNPRVRARIEAVDDADLFLSVTTIGEIVRGIALLDAGGRRDELDAWIRSIEDHHGRQILTIDAGTSRICGEIDARARRAGYTIPAADGLIAATALQHDMAVMTRNRDHFRPTGVRVIDPWAEDG